jgi:hypothetical protein
MLVALVAGFGAYAFCRRALGLSFWPAAVAAWCYPLTAYFIFWQGYYNAAPVCWLPWMLLAVDKTVRGPTRLAAPGLALAAGATLLSGAVDIAAQVLLASGLFALWCLFDEFRKQSRTCAIKAVLSLSAAWLLGLLIAAPYVMPLVEYSQTGERMARRGAGSEERPPTGLPALPQVVLPDMYGAFGMMKTGSFRFTGDSQQESSAAAHAGLVATLFFAPLAWCDPRRRRIAFALAGLGLIALSWSFNVPGLVSVLRLPGLNMFSHNRFVFLAAFAFLALAAVGLEVFARGHIEWRRWFWFPIASVALLYAFCCYRALNLPEPIATQLEQAIQSGRQAGWVRNIESVRTVQDWFVRHYASGAVLCGIALAGWVVVWLRKPWQPRLFAPLAVALAGELLWFGYGRNVQASPELYFPKVPALEQLAAGGSGRIIGAKCLPATLSVMCGLNDVRGYDGVDPSAYVELLQLAADPSIPPLSYAMVQWLAPLHSFTPEGHARLSPVLDLLGVRHVIFRGTPPAGVRTVATSEDYWVAENPRALPRAFVPERVEAVPDPSERLRRMGSPEFDPRKVAFTGAPVDVSGACRGTADVSSETPTRITLSLNMETPGLVVLADRWDKGWRAYLKGNPLPVLVVDHALRGVIVPAGMEILEFRYEPASFSWGLPLSGLGLMGSVIWLAVGTRQPRAANAL